MPSIPNEEVAMKLAVIGKEGCREVMCFAKAKGPVLYCVTRTVS